MSTFKHAEIHETGLFLLYTYILQMRKDSNIPDNMYMYSLIN